MFLSSKKINPRVVFFLTCIALIALRVFLISEYPINTMDSAFSCTPSFSFLNGYGAFNVFAQNYPANLFGFLGIPLFLLYDGVYCIPLFFEVLKIFFCYQVYRILTKTSLNKFEIYLVIILVFCDYTVNGYGEEAGLCGFILLAFSKVLNKKRIRYEVLFSTCFLFFIIHPIASIIFAILVGLYIYEKRLIRIDKNLFLSSGIFILSCFLYLLLFKTGNEIVFYSFSKYSILDLDFSMHFFVGSFPLIAVLLYLILKYSNLSFVRIFVLVLIVLISIFFRMSEYKLYGIAFLIYFILNPRRHREFELISKFGMIVYIGGTLASLFLCYGTPLYKLFEEREHYDKTKIIVQELTEDSKGATTKFFVQTEFLMPFYSNSNTRLIVAGSPQSHISEGDILYVCEKTYLLAVENSLKEYVYKKDLLITPSEGLPALSTLGSLRTQKYGLWRYKVLKRIK